MVAAIGAVAGVAGAAISADGAKSAANAQSGASDQAQMMQAMAAAQQRADLAPWTQAGGAAQSRLNQYLGIGGVGSSGVTSMGLATGLSPDKVREQLLSRYTKQAAAGGAGAPGYANGNEAINALGGAGAAQYFQDQAKANQGNLSSLWTSPDSATNGGSGPSAVAGGGSTIDEEGLNAAIAKYYEEQNAQNAAAAQDPTYGSLLTPYKNGQDFSFTGENLASDPGYKFGLDQGTQGIERAQAARGNFLSGAAIKEATRFNEDYAGTKFNDAFNRASSTWNTNLNAYDNNRSRIYSFLTGVSTLGQNSAAQVGAGNQQATNNATNALMQGANAQSAGAIASGNALQSGINNGVNTYNWNNMLSKGGGYSGSTGYTGNSDPLGNMINANNGWNSQV